MVIKRVSISTISLWEVQIDIRRVEANVFLVFDSKYVVPLKNLYFVFIEEIEMWYTETYKQSIVLHQYRPE